MNQVNIYSQYFVALYCSMVRYYDYSLFGLSAATLSTEFIPSQSDTLKLMGFFGIFSISMLARPIGSIVLGTIADKITRNKAAKLSAILGTIATSAICAIPSYKMIGVSSMLVLILCRMLFLFSLAGETDIIRVYVAEIFKNRKHFAIGILSFTTQIGVLLASYMYYLSINNQCTNLWRINFLFGGILGTVAIYLRFKFKDNFSYKKHSDVDINYSEIFLILGNNKTKFLLSLIINGSIGGLYNFLIIFLHAFIIKMHDQFNIIQKITNTEIILIYSLSCILSGYIADFVNPKKQILYSLILSIIAIIIIKLSLIDNVAFVSIHLILVCILPFYSIPLQLIVQHFFLPDIRVRMCSISHSLGSMILSSTTPFFCMLIWNYTQSLLLVSALPILLLFILLFAIFYVNIS